MSTIDVEISAQSKTADRGLFPTPSLRAGYRSTVGRRKLDLRAAADDGMGALLEYLLKNGPGTVPDIARTRFVRRQHIQKLVNALLKEDLVRLEDNPLHRCSSLVLLTKQGRAIST